MGLTHLEPGLPTTSRDLRGDHTRKKDRRFITHMPGRKVNRNEMKKDKKDVSMTAPQRLEDNNDDERQASRHVCVKDR